MDADLDTLATALYVRIDDTLADRPELRPWRPKVGIAPKLSDAELLTLAVLQVLLGFEHEARWLRHARAHLVELFPYLPGQAGYNKRLRKVSSPAPGPDPGAGHRHEEPLRVVADRAAEAPMPSSSGFMPSSGRSKPSMSTPKYLLSSAGKTVTAPARSEGLRRRRGQRRQARRAEGCRGERRRGPSRRAVCTR